MLHIHLLGGFRVLFSDQLVAEINNSPRLQELMAYLVLQRRAPLPRHRLAMQFWQNSSEQQARANLRNLLQRLQQILPAMDDYLKIEPHTLAWQENAVVSSDVTAFEALLKEGLQAADATLRTQALMRAVELYQGDLLPHLYDDWVLVERERLRDHLIQALEQLIELAEQQRDYPSAIAHLRRLLRHDLLREESYRRLMLLHARHGDRTGVVRVYRECAELLQRELQEQPSQPTNDLYARLLRGAEGSPYQSQAHVFPQRLPLVGRRREWMALEQAWRGVQQGRAHITLVNGPIGVGKSHLAHELLLNVQRQGMTGVYLRCDPAGVQVAFAPVATWLRNQGVLQKAHELEAAVRSELARLAPELNQAPTLPALLAPPRDGWQRRALFEALAHFLLTDGQPTLLVVDDLEWCDPETLEWLHYLVQRSDRTPVLVAATLCLAEADALPLLQRWQLTLQRHGRLSQLTLGPLSLEESTALVTVLVDLPPSETAMRQLYERSEGFPLLLVESVAAGLFHPETGLQADPIQAPGVRLVYERWLAALSPEASRAIKLVTAFGRPFTIEEMARLSSQPEAELLLALDELLHRHLLVEAEGARYAFVHNQVRTLVYSELTGARRMYLERLVEKGMCDT
jgi:DNA-binding SARP family transcriptional activator